MPVPGDVLDACVSRASRAARRPWVLGLQGPQGCGKSTLAAGIVAALEARGLHAATVSIDEFYLTYDEQQALAARHAGNPYLLYRGSPGTHDVALGAEVLAELCALGPGQRALVPVYAKGARGGRGDRAPRETWRTVTGRLDALVLEGWMLGFTALGDALEDPLLCAVDALLPPYEAWTSRLDTFLRLDVPSLETIVAWRVDSERARRAAGDDGLSDDQARDYIERFLPAYRAYLPRLEARPPCADVLRLRLGPDRQAISLQG